MAKVGRTFILKSIFGNVRELEKAVAGYFEQCSKKNKPSTLERLAEFLGCSDRTLTRYKDYYEKWEDYMEGNIDEEIDYCEKMEFCRPIKKAYQRIKAEDIERLKERGNSGDIFIAKNHGYKDNLSLEHTGEIKTENPYAGLTTEELKKLIEK